MSASQATSWDARARRDAAIPGRVLMEAAGRAVAWMLAREFPERVRDGVLVVTGHGNNGGDGWVAARALHAAGAPVWAVESPGERSPDCEANRTLALRDGVEAVATGALWPRAGLVLDALLGTGASGAPRGPLGELARHIAEYGAPVVALDGPTGLDLSTGEAHGPVRAALTITFGGARRGHLLARDWCGTIGVVDIGFPAPDASWPRLVTDGAAAQLVPPMHADMHKGTRGKVVVVGGSEGMAGAALHAASGALAVGAGLVRLVSEQATVRAAQAYLPDALTTEVTLGPQLEDEAAAALEWADAVVLGPGLGRGEHRSRFVEHVLRAAHVPVIVDADALHAGRAALTSGEASRVFTPHPGEFAAMFPDLTDAVGADRFAALEQGLEAVVGSGGGSPPATLLLKGVPTLIASASQLMGVVAAGNPALATGGSGDLLAGMIGAFLARGLGPHEAAVLGAQVLGRAADLAAEQYGVRSTRPADVLAALPDLWRLWALAAPVRPPLLVRLEPPRER